MGMNPIYFDYAAATPLHPAVVKAMSPYFTDKFYNPSATYQEGRAVKNNLLAARQTAAEQLGVRANEIIFTAGGTEANNLAIHGVARGVASPRIISTAIEHDSVLAPLKNYDTTLIGVDANGRVELTALEQAITNKTILVSVGLVNSEIGVIQDLQAIARCIDTVKKERAKRGNTLPLYLHSDACQATNYMSVQAKKIGIDLLTINGGKMYGPKQSGILYVRAGISLTPIIVGGGQEFGLRSGTENVAAAIGLAEAFKIAQYGRAETTSYMVQLQNHFIDQLAIRLPDARINGSLKNRIANNIHITLPGIDNERAMMLLDERGIMCAVGSACSASKDEPSHVLRALGLSDEHARASLRFTMGSATKKEDIDTAIAALMRVPRL
jgi:cysteine desulfurase